MSTEDREQLIRKLESIRSEYDAFPEEFEALSSAIECVRTDGATRGTNPSVITKQDILDSMELIRNACFRRLCSECEFCFIDKDGRPRCGIRFRVGAHLKNGLQPLFWHIEPDYEELLRGKKNE